MKWSGVILATITLGEGFMKLIEHLILRLIPLGIVAGIVASMFSSSTPLQSTRVEAINVQSDPGASYAAGNFDSLLVSEISAGVNYVHETINWSEIETTQGVYNWTAGKPLDAITTSENSAEVKIIAVLTGGPVYLTNAPGQPVNTTDFLVRWANFVQAAVNQFGDSVDIWEIGTQVNSLTGMSPFLIPSYPNSALIPDPVTYAQMVKAASKIIKNADPNDQVWMGSLVSAASSQCSVNPLTFLLEVNGTKAWNVIDSVQYSPSRGALAPEASLTAVNTSCQSTLPTNSTTMAGEVQSLLDLARQLGGKTVRIEDLGWSGDELTVLASNRGITTDQVQADLLVRASVLLLGNDNLTQLFWRVDPAAQPSSFAALSNLNSVLRGAKLVSQVQGQTGSVFEYRFQKGSKWILIAWRSTDGDNPYPVSLSSLGVSKLTAYPVDAVSFSTENGTVIPVDAAGNAIIMLNERPVVFIGQMDGVSEALQADAADQLDLWKAGLQNVAHQAMNEVKAVVLQALESVLNSAKDQAIQWGEDKLNELLN